MMSKLNGFKDLWLENEHEKPTGITYDDESRFHQKEPLPFDSPIRGKKGMRLDYFLLKNSGYQIQTNTNLVMIESSPGREVSDHYGLKTALKFDA